MWFKSLRSGVAYCMLVGFSFWLLGVSGTPSNSSSFPMMQVAAASEKGEEVKEESMEKSKDDMSKEDMKKKGEKKKMKKKNKNKMKKKGEAKKPPEE